MDRLEELYSEAESLMRAGQARRAVDRLGDALLELEGMRVALAGLQGSRRVGGETSPIPRGRLRREVEIGPACPETLEAASDRLRRLARQVRLEVQRLERERELLRERRKLTRTFAGVSDSEGNELDRSA